MRRLFLSILLTLFIVPLTIAAELKVGDMAPDFKLQGTDGNIYTLSQFKGKKAVVLAWFPRAYTYGCTIECKSLAENGHLLRKFNAQYFMASVDPIDKNRGFAAETKADFPLLSDPTKEAAEAYGVKHLLGFAKRHTFYIDKNGKIAKIDRDVEPKTSAEDMAKNMEALGFKE
ncbi:peroxiredoxin [Flocculibacter collagenilyticus]|uniref:peroxiredoxin n=1 Tax=Flocculibacter collagenilyticus TaxID=2744479 RepID=UPI0018F482E3|nr:peroxiredoxin [Flocculibacter collagenilyticus]